MDRSSVIFCALAVVAAVALSVFGYQVAALSDDEVAAAKTPVAAEEMGVVDIGDGYGEMAVSELMDFYIQNPPVKATGAAQAAEPERRFGGC